LGFKCFSLGQSNYKEWKLTDEKELLQLDLRFKQAESPLKENWKQSDLLTEILLQQGFPLDSQILPVFEKLGNKISRVHSDFCDHDLFVCFDEKIEDKTVNSLDLHSENAFICLDSALSDQSKMRLSDHCNLKII
jgi:adenine-specific DNA-methyltransferase